MLSIASEFIHQNYTSSMQLYDRWLYTVDAMRRHLAEVDQALGVESEEDET